MLAVLSLQLGAVGAGSVSMVCMDILRPDGRKGTRGRAGEKLPMGSAALASEQAS